MKWTKNTVLSEPKHLTQEEFESLKSWVQSPNSALPRPIQEVLLKLMNEYLNLLKSKKNSLQTLRALREAMGLLPKSEKGSSLLNQEALSEKK